VHEEVYILIFMQLVEAGCRIVAIYGSTEGGCITRYHESSRDPKLWSWVEFANHVKPRWIPYGDFQTPQPHNDTPHLQELELLTCETHQLAVENLADLPGYATQDLWARHPEYPNLWKPWAMLSLSSMPLTDSYMQRRTRGRCHRDGQRRKDGTRSD
jgi:hypothetical protein